MARKKPLERKLAVGNIRDVSGEVNIAGGDVVKNIQILNQRALTVAEEADRARELEGKLLAEGVSFLLQKLFNETKPEIAKNENPYKGLLPYNLNEAEIFFGREKTITKFIKCIQQDPLTILHAESGAGKSSLLQAGVAAQLISQGDLAICLRGSYRNSVELIKSTFLSDLTLTPALIQASLRDFLRRVGAVLGPKVTLYLFLDQFEGFFNVPFDERQLFIESLAECLNDPGLKVRWGIALRAESLSALAEFENYGIAPFKNTFVLNRLSRTEAEKVILEPAKRANITYEPELIENILDALSSNNEIIPTQLQLVCSALVENVAEDKILTMAQFTQLGGTEGILRDYLKRELEYLPIQDQAIAWKILRALITTDRLRAIKTEQELEEELTISGVSLDQIRTTLIRLTERRLVIKSNVSEITYELAHDYLILEIELDPQERGRKTAQELLDQETRTYQRHRTLLTPERLALIEPYQMDLRYSGDARQLISESQKTMLVVKRRQSAIYLGVTIIATIIAVAMSILGIWGQRNANEAKNNLVIANSQASTAQAASTFAVAQQDDAQKQRLIALASKLAIQAKYVNSLEINQFNQRVALLLSVQSIKLLPSSEAAEVIEKNTLPIHSLQIQPYRGTGDYRQVVYSPDGNFIVAANNQGVVNIWNAATGEEISKIEFGSYVESAIVNISPNGKYLLSGGCEENDQLTVCNKSSVRLSELSTGKELSRVSYPGVVTSVAFSPTGNYVVTDGCEIPDYYLVCKNWSVRVWETKSGSETLRINHSLREEAFAFSSDEKYIISGRGVWEIATGKEVMHAPIPVDEIQTAVAFSPDRKYIATGGCGKSSPSNCLQAVVRIWDSYTGKEISQFQHENWVNSIAFSPNGKYLSSASQDKSVIIWDLSSDKEVAQLFHDDSVFSVAFSPDSEFLASGSADNTARVWETTTGKVVDYISNDDSIYSVSFSSDSNYVLLGEHARIQVWKVISNTEIFRGSYKFWSTYANFDTTGDSVLSAGCDQVNENGYCNQAVIKAWSLKAREEKMIIATQTIDHQIPVTSSVDGKYILNGGCDQYSFPLCLKGAVQIRLSSTGKKIRQFSSGGEVTTLAINQNGKYVVYGGCDKDETPICRNSSIHVVMFDSGQEIWTAKYQGNISKVVFSPDSKYVVSIVNIETCDRMFDYYCPQETVRLLQIQDGKEIAQITKLKRFSAIVFSPDGKYMALGGAANVTGNDGVALLLNLNSGNEMAQYKSIYEVTSLDFSPDGNFLAVGGWYNTVSIWEITTGKEVVQLHHDDNVNSIDFSPNGKNLVTGSADGTARVWETFSGQELVRMEHKGSIYSAFFSPDGKYIVSAGADGIVRVWTWLSEDLIQNACSRITRNLTRAEWKQYIGDALPYQAVCEKLPIEQEVATSTPTLHP